MPMMNSFRNGLVSVGLVFLDKEWIEAETITNADPHLNSSGCSLLLQYERQLVFLLRQSRQSCTLILLADKQLKVSYHWNIDPSLDSRMRSMVHIRKADTC